MQNLTADGRERIAEIAARYGISFDAAMTLLEALIRGGGTMAQFSHPELGGSGQWMQGGMTMVGDMFNQSLKAKVEGLCYELNGVLASQPFEPQPRQDYQPPNAPGGGWQSQSQGSGGVTSLFVGGMGGMPGGWWPPELGSPNSTGSQNDIRYAYFAAARRLAIDVNGVVTVYDTADHQISGVSQQQQTGGASLTFSSQYGVVPVTGLRRVESGGTPAPEATPMPAGESGASAQAGPVASAGSGAPGEGRQDGAAQPGSPIDALTTETLSGSRWSFGRAGSASSGTVTLAADGTLGGDVHPRARYWSIEDGILCFFDSEGRPFARFAAILREGGSTILGGSDTGAAAEGFELRSGHAESAAPTAAPAMAAPGVPIDLAGTDWVLSDGGGATLAGLSFLPDGRISGGRPTEARWRWDGPCLVLLHDSGRPTVRFDTFQFRNGRWLLSGPLLSNETMTYRLQPK